MFVKKISTQTRSNRTSRIKAVTEFPHRFAANFYTYIAYIYVSNSGKRSPRKGLIIGMVFLLLGAAAFVCFFLYDLQGITGRFPLLRAGFLIGCLMLVGATAGLMTHVIRMYGIILWRAVVGGAALFFLGLLLYTLFVALPLSPTYTPRASKAPPPLCTAGVYALCRHPGVLWLTGFYFSLWLALGSAVLLSAFAVFAALDIAYAGFQDVCTFPRMFAGYASYKTTTPFLLPNRRSIRRCLDTLSRKGGSGS